MVEKLINTILQLLPTDAAQEVKKNIETAIENQFEHMNLVTKAQLEIQEKILRRTRDRITELEQKVVILEEQLNRS